MKPRGSQSGGRGRVARHEGAEETRVRQRTFFAFRNFRSLKFLGRLNLTPDGFSLPSWSLHVTPLPHSSPFPTSTGIHGGTEAGVCGEQLGKHLLFFCFGFFFPPRFFLGLNIGWDIRTATTCSKRRKNKHNRLFKIPIQITGHFRGSQPFVMLQTEACARSWLWPQRAPC